MAKNIHTCNVIRWIISRNTQSIHTVACLMYNHIAVAAVKAAFISHIAYIIMKVIMYCLGNP